MSKPTKEEEKIEINLLLTKCCNANHYYNPDIYTRMDGSVGSFLMGHKRGNTCRACGKLANLKKITFFVEGVTR